MSHYACSVRRKRSSKSLDGVNKPAKEVSANPRPKTKLPKSRAAYDVEDAEPWKKLRSKFSSHSPFNILGVLQEPLQAETADAHDADDMDPWEEELSSNFYDHGFIEELTEPPQSDCSLLSGSMNNLTKRTSDMSTQVNMYHCRECRRHLKFGKEFNDERENNERESGMMDYSNQRGYSSRRCLDLCHSSDFVESEVGANDDHEVHDEEVASEGDIENILDTLPKSNQKQHRSRNTYTLSSNPSEQSCSESESRLTGLKDYSTMPTDNILNSVFKITCDNGQSSQNWKRFFTILFFVVLISLSIAREWKNFDTSLRNLLSFLYPQDEPEEEELSYFWKILGYFYLLHDARKISLF